jgi:hypothetical protein
LKQGYRLMWAVRLRTLAILLSCSVVPIASAENAVSLPLDDVSVVTPHNVTVRAVRHAGSDALEAHQAGVIKGFDPDTFAYVPGLDFHDGTIEVDVAGSVLPSAQAAARGFVGVAFRIDVTGGTFASEGLYVRPTNGRSDDQLRRNHSTQYFSFPEWDFERLRREALGQYEFYADVAPDEWIHLRIEVSGARAEFYVNGASQPTLIVRDLKHGAHAHGAVGLWAGNGADCHFRNLSIRPR